MAASNEAHTMVAEWLSQARSAVVFTGAGISTESGIPDFRSPGGVWATSQPVYFDEFLASGQARREYWRQKSISHGDFERATPNDAHRVIARWEDRGTIEAVITQNIDGLHQAAGSRRVLELHGTARQVGCLDCLTRFEADEMVAKFLADNEPPSCPSCGGLLKHATISFGQALPADVLNESIRLSSSADLLMVIGSSLVVHPAASLPPLAKQHGARLVIINRDPTPQDESADVVFHDASGDTLTKIDRCLMDRQSQHA